MKNQLCIRPKRKSNHKQYEADAGFDVMKKFNTEEELFRVLTDILMPPTPNVI
jgi:hypothetical protein